MSRGTDTTAAADQGRAAALEDAARQLADSGRVPDTADALRESLWHLALSPREAKCVRELALQTLAARAGPVRVYRLASAGPAPDAEQRRLRELRPSCPTKQESVTAILAYSGLRLSAAAARLLAPQGRRVAIYADDMARCLEISADDGGGWSMHTMQTAGARGPADLLRSWGLPAGRHPMERTERDGRTVLVLRAPEGADRVT